MHMDRTFPIKGRYVVLIWLIPLFYLPGLDYVYSLIDQDSQWYWYDIAYYYYYQTILVVLLASLVIWQKVKWRGMLSSAERKDYLPAIKLTAFTFLFSIAAVYALFYPLSFIVPEFVNFWLIDLPPVIYRDYDQFPILPNLLSFVSLVVLAPVTEEFIFRGVLLHRWSEKWGINKAILVSSILFGLAHPDPVGATAFGIAMSVLYLKTQTLVVPMVCHGLYNFVVWLIEVGYMIWLGPYYEYTLEDFQSEWAIGLIAGIFASFWVYTYLNSKKSRRVWCLPKL